MNAKLRPIIEAVKAEITASKHATPVKELKARIKDMAPLSGRFSEALKSGFGLIAEIKEKSPSAGLMRPQNVKDAYDCYEKSSLVRAISVLTNKVHFGMSIDRLQDARNRFSKPILRKDFIVDEYQIYQARAYGADAILLMGNVLDSGKLLNFWQTAKGMGLEVLFEAHTAAQIKSIPKGADICGINCRMMDSGNLQFRLPVSYRVSRMLYKFTGDLTTDLDRFEMIDSLPRGCVKVAESGISPSTVHYINGRGYNAALVGTSLLTAPEGVWSALRKFEEALSGKTAGSPVDEPTMVHSHA